MNILMLVAPPFAGWMRDVRGGLYPGFLGLGGVQFPGWSLLSVCQESQTGTLTTRPIRIDRSIHVLLEYESWESLI